MRGVRGFEARLTCSLQRQPRPQREEKLHAQGTLHDYQSQDLKDCVAFQNVPVCVCFLGRREENEQI